MLDYTDPAMYMPITPPDEAIVCLSCGLVTVTGARDIHAAFHQWMDNATELLAPGRPLDTPPLAG